MRVHPGMKNRIRSAPEHQESPCALWRRVRLERVCRRYRVPKPLVIPSVAKNPRIWPLSLSVLNARAHALQQEEARMDRLCRKKDLEEQALFAEIDRVTQARGEYEKASTHYRLQIRTQMDADQITRLETGR